MLNTPVLADQFRTSYWHVVEMWEDFAEAYVALFNCARENNSLLIFVKGLEIFARVVEGMFEELEFNTVSCYPRIFEFPIPIDSLPIPESNLDCDYMSSHSFPEWRTIMDIRFYFLNLEAENFGTVYRRIKCISYNITESNYRRNNRVLKFLECCKGKTSSCTRDELYEDLENLQKLENLSLYFLAPLMVLKIRLCLSLKRKVDPWYSFLLGCHPRLGEDSNVLKISRCQPVLRRIFHYTVGKNNWAWETMEHIERMKSQCSKLIRLVKQRNKYLIPELLLWRDLKTAKFSYEFEKELIDSCTGNGIADWNCEYGKTLDLTAPLDSEKDGKQLALFAIHALGKSGQKFLLENESDCRDGDLRPTAPDSTSHADVRDRGQCRVDLTQNRLVSRRHSI